VVPSRPTELYVATDLYRGMGDARRALEVVEQATKIRPAPIWALQAKGAILRDIEQYRESADAYRAALDLDPGDVASRVGYALTLAEWPESQPSDVRAALQLVDESLRRYPAYAWARIARGMLQIRLGEVRAGLQTLAAVRDAEAKIVSARAASLVQIDYYMGIAYQRLGQPGDARRAFSRVAPDDATADGSSGLATAKYVRKARGLLERS
jgi:tetratricopeptide (TPR) repeat protein